MHDLASVFTIDIAAYAVMSNHYHAVLYIDKEKALNWPDTQVISAGRKYSKPPAWPYAIFRGDALDHGTQRNHQPMAKSLDGSQLVYALLKRVYCPSSPCRQTTPI
ncbi:hypothetical protein ACJJIK_09690 [Microbulbifer sp. ZKSA006]|uniref:hypothetical protein n=1 Tax=Microbulbifer sp. ZKSA006 TaxID=3243390 RepID=UPI0040390DE9